MIDALLRKHGRELRSRWLFMAAVGLAPGILTALDLSSRSGSHGADSISFLAIFGLMVLAVFPARAAGTGVCASIGTRPQRGTDPSLLFTLSLPVRRRSLFFWRTTSGILAMESAALVALGIDGILLERLGVPWRTLTPALWLLPVLLLFYFLDALLFTWFSELTTMQIQLVGFVILWFALRRAGALDKITVALRHFSPLSVLLPVCVLSLALAAATVWRLDRQNY
jgi:hypothetical protein